MSKLENLSANVYFFPSVSGSEVFRWCPIHWITSLHCNLCKYCCVILAHSVMKVEYLLSCYKP